MTQTEAHKGASAPLPPAAGSEFIQGVKYALRLKAFDDAAVHAIASEHNVTLPIARVLYARGFRTSDQVRSYLFASYDRDVPHPSLLLGAQVAVERMRKAIHNKEKILVFGDYDVDGITSSALMMSCLLPLGADINFFLPVRKRDGYGLSSKVVKKAAQSGYSLIITVDNGISAFEPARVAAECGIDLIITDHHRPHDGLPQALAIVNPNQFDCTYPFKGLCGAGVIFKLISLIYEYEGLTLPPKTYELLMLGTIADVMPLQSENRFWVQYGLGLVNQGRSYALDVLAQNGKLAQKALTSLDVGFMISPQINALGRLSDPRDAVKFLISSNKEDVDRIGKVLFEINEARKRVEREIYEEVDGEIKKGAINLTRENIIVAAGGGWPAGVIGLVAGKLMHAYGRPAILFHMTDDGIAKGSCRSIAEFNMFDALTENKDLLITFGGHSCAAGLSLKKENIAQLKANLEEKIARELTPFDLTQKLELDAEVELSELTKRLFEDVERLEPFGNANPQPNFFIRSVNLLSPPRLLKDKHVKTAIVAQGVIKQVIFFNRPDLYPILNEIGSKPFHVVGCISKNEWNGNMNIELQGLDIAL
jgi:single-stranded-DNA-specific exonuclease